MADLATIRGYVEDIIYGSIPRTRPTEDTLVTGINTTDTDPAFALYDATWKRGDRAEFQPDGEIVILTADHPASASTATVRRAQHGTTAASHTAGDVVRRNPIFDVDYLNRQINNVIDLECQNLFTRQERTVTWTSSDTSVDLAAADTEVESVYQFDLAGAGEFEPFPRGWWDTQIVNTAVAPNGRILRIRRVRDSSATVYYRARQRPMSSDIAAISDDIVACIPWRAAAKALSGRASNIDLLRSPGDEDRFDVRRAISIWNAEFRESKNAVHRKLRKEFTPEKKYVPQRPRRGW